MRRFIQAQVEEGYNREIKHDAGHLMTWLDCFLGFLVRTLVTYLSYLVFACICRWSHLPKLGTSQLSAWFIKQKAPPMQRSSRDELWSCLQYFKCLWYLRLNGNPSLGLLQCWPEASDVFFPSRQVPVIDFKSQMSGACFRWSFFPSQYECRNLAAQRRHLSITKGSCDSMRRW